MGRWIEAEFPGLCEPEESPRESELVQRRLWQSEGLVEQDQSQWSQLGKRINSADSGGDAGLPHL